MGKSWKKWGVYFGEVRREKKDHLVGLFQDSTSPPSATGIKKMKILGFGASVTLN